jgi:hypothetical protein
MLRKPPVTSALSETAPPSRKDYRKTEGARPRRQVDNLLNRGRFLEYAVRSTKARPGKK